MTLTATTISKTYGERLVLDSASVAIKPGEITCVVGPSGAGKTTLLRCMAGLEKPDSGLVNFDGRNIYEGDQSIIWPDMTVVFQSLFLWPHMTLAENIMLPARDRIDEAELKSRFDQVVNDFGMSEFVNRFPNEASGGQRQRAALARAVMLRPKIMLLDEITSALDVEQVANILTILEKCKEQGIGMLIITHLLNFAKRMADQMVFIDDGKVVEQGDVKLLVQPQTKRLQSFLSLVDLAS